MMSLKKMVSLVLFSTSFFLGACVQMPTEKQSVSDLRPQISFQFATTDQVVSNSRIVINGLEMGLVKDFPEGVSSLKVISGTHQLQVLNGKQVLFEERFYVGDGVNKTFVVK